MFDIGLNYRSHAEESDMAVPEVPATFTKFPTCLARPLDDIGIHRDTVDWEVELVAIIGPRALPKNGVQRRGSPPEPSSVRQIRSAFRGRAPVG